MVIVELRRLRGMVRARNEPLAPAVLEERREKISELKERITGDIAGV